MTRNEDAPRLDTADAVKLWLSERFAHETDPEQILRIVAETIGRYLRVTRVGYGEVEPGSDWITIPIDWTDGIPTMVGRHPLYRRSAFVQEYVRGRTMVVADVATLNLQEEERRLMADTFCRSCIAVPLVHDGAFVALFSATHSVPRAWTEEEVTLVAQTGARVWSALQQVRAAKRLAESEEQFRTLAESMPGICWIADPDGLAIWINRAGDAYFDGMMTSVADTGNVIHPDDLEDTLSRWGAALASGTPLEMTIRMHDATGVYRPFLSRAQPILDTAGRVARWCITHIDVSEQRAVDRRQTVLRALNDRTRDLAQVPAILGVAAALLADYLGIAQMAYGAADDGDPARFALWHTSGGAAPPGPARAVRFGADEEPLHVAWLRGDTVAVDDLSLPDRLVGEALRSAAQAAGVASGIGVPLVKDGRLVAVFAPLHDAPRAWSAEEIALCEEVAERVWVMLERARAEERLVESEALLATFMDKAPIGMHLKDAAGRYLRINPELAAAMGRPIEDILGRHPDELMPAPVATVIEDIERQARAGQLATAEFHGGTRERWRSVLSIVFPIPGEGMARTAGFTIDLTERKQAEAALEQSREALYQTEKLSALGSLLAGVSHELNNPLSIVVAQAVMMERQARGTEIAERAQKVRRAADRCARIVQTFLAMARQKRPERAAVDLNAVVTAALELADYGLRTEGIAVARSLAPDLPRIAADADQLHQIVINLVINAQQAMVEAGTRNKRLTITTAPGPEPQTVILDVADSGPGVPDEARRRIFEPFYTTKPQGEGTGVGLSFSQGLAEAHGGRLALVRSKTGATFRLTLPIDETLTLPRVVADEPAAADLVARRALVVDDEEEIAEALADFLSIEGFACEIAIGGAAAKVLLAAGQYDLVMSDLRMPDVDGPALHAWLVDARPDLAARIAFTTGDTLGAAAARFLASVDRPVLEKPFMPDAVHRLLEQMELA